MADVTVVYYTGGNEPERFERNIRAALLESIGDLPLISVSQAPIDFGENICVGPVGVSSQNAYRQLQVGAKAASTRFVAVAEPDCLYPPEYFRFRPRRDDMCYWAWPIYVLFAMNGKSKVAFHKSMSCEAAMVVNREHLIDAFDRLLAGCGMWGDACAGNGYPYFRHSVKHRSFDVSVPVVTFKTGHGLHRKTPIRRQSATRAIPHWGDTNELVRRFLG